MFCLNGKLLCFYESPHVLIHLRTDQNLALSGADTVPLCQADYVTDDSELHAIFSADEAMHDLSTMDSDTKIAARSSPELTHFI